MALKIRTLILVVVAVLMSLDSAYAAGAQSVGSVKLRESNVKGNLVSGAGLPGVTLVSLASNEFLYITQICRNDTGLGTYSIVTTTTLGIISVITPDTDGDGTMACSTFNPPLLVPQGDDVLCDVTGSSKCMVIGVVSTK